MTSGRHIRVPLLALCVILYFGCADVKYFDYVCFYHDAGQVVFVMSYVFEKHNEVVSETYCK